MLMQNEAYAIENLSCQVDKAQVVTSSGPVTA